MSVTAFPEERKPARLKVAKACTVRTTLCRVPAISVGVDSTAAPSCGE